MNTDIRLSVDFWSHPKTVKLKRRLGLEGPVALQVLWSWAAKNRPEGDLSGMDDEDIEIAAGWETPDCLPGGSDPIPDFVPTLVELRWLDKTDGGYVLHEWAEHNGWVADAPMRGDVARLSVMASKYPLLHAKYVAAGAKGITKEEYERATKEYKEQQIANGETTNDNESFNERSTNDNAASSPSPSPSPTHNVTTPPTPPARGDRGEGRRERRARGRDSPKPPTLPPTFDEAAARFKARYGIDTTGGGNHAGTGLATVSNAHAGG